MALPLSGPISMSMVNKILCFSSPYNQSISLNTTAVRALFGKPTANSQISFSDGYGKTPKTRIANATGGSISYDGDYQIHTFTDSGVFTVTQRDQSNIPFGWAFCDGGSGGGYGNYGGNIPEEGGGAGGDGGGAFYDNSDTSFTLNNFNINTGYAITIGAGGAIDVSGGSTSFSHSGGTHYAGYPYGGGSGGQGAYLDNNTEQVFFPAQNGGYGGSITMQLFGSNVLTIHLGGGGGGGGTAYNGPGNGGGTAGGGYGGAGGGNNAYGSDASNSSYYGSGGGGGGGNGTGTTNSYRALGGQGTAGILIFKFKYQIDGGC